VSQDLPYTVPGVLAGRDAGGGMPGYYEPPAGLYAYGTSRRRLRPAVPPPPRPGRPRKAPAPAPVVAVTAGPATRCGGCDYILGSPGCLITCGPDLPDGIVTARRHDGHDPATGGFT
jgi:hypothetical protein